MNNNQLAPHEILELHELLNTNILGVKKITASMSMVQDENLKNIMQNSLNEKKTRIQEIQNFINSQAGAQNSQNNQNNNINNQGNSQS